MRLELQTEVPDPRFFLPAFLYGTNRGTEPRYFGQNGRSPLFPRLSLTLSELPYAGEWMVRADRLSHPVAALWDGTAMHALCVPPVREDGFNGFFCRWGRKESAVGFTLGYENAPVLYVECITTAPASFGCLHIGAGQQFSTSFQLYTQQGGDEQTLSVILRKVYRLFHQPPRQGPAMERAVEDIAQAIWEDAYVPDLKSYSTRVFLEQGEIRQEPLAAIAWTGGAEIAVPMLRAAWRLGRQDMRRQALEVVDNIVEHSRNPASGLPFDAQDETGWTTAGWWDGCLAQSGHAAYLAGQALYYILTAWEVEKEQGTEHPRWAGFARGCLEQMLRTQNPQGAFPCLWSARDGRGLDYEGFGGCWCAAAAAAFGRLLEDKTMLKAAAEAVRYYHNEYLRHMECWGTPLDTYKAADSEGILAFIKACGQLHRATGEECWLEMLREGLEYEFTFRFCWNPPIQTPPLGTLGWSSCGGSVTSVCNPHIHPMSVAVCDELLYCARQTGDDYLRRRLEDTVGWARQTYSTRAGEYGYGKKGWMSERFCYSEGLLTERYPDGSPCSTWLCFLPWGAANILEGLCGDVWEEFCPQDAKKDTN